jgi:hypothetical protein
MRSLAPYVIALTPLLLQGSLLQKPSVEQDQQQQHQQQSTKEPFCYSPFRQTHVEVRHTESKGVGYKNGYTTFEWFGLVDDDSSFMPFLDLRGHVFNDGKLAGNFGLGERTFIQSINHIFGVYLYYDARHDTHGLNVSQLSPGVEFIGKRVEYRMNGYFPVGRAQSHRYGNEFSQFKANQIIVSRKKKYTLKGGDAELGFHLTQSTRQDFYVGAGPYYFTADPFSSWGGKARLLWRYKDYVSLEASYSYDRLFHNIFQGTVGLMYPLGSKLKRKGECNPPSPDLALSRAAFAPYRFEIPVVKKHHHHKVAVNPATLLPWNVWFVDNTSHSAGTYESPFSTLAQAQNASGPNDIIYVLPGDGTTTGMNAGIVLQNNQKLFGAGTDQMITTTTGSLTIPAHSLQSPTLTNASGSVVTLANGNEVSGLNLSMTLMNSTGIHSPAGGFSGGVSIHNNRITGTGVQFGMVLQGGGLTLIQNNSVLDLVGASNLTGIQVQVINSNTMQGVITGNYTMGYVFGISCFVDSGGTGDFLIANNTITKTNSNVASGIFLAANATSGKSLTAKVLHNQFFMMSGHGIQIGNGSGFIAQQACVKIQGNTMHQYSQGLNGVLINPPAAGRQVNVTAYNNNFLNIATGEFGISASGAAGATLCLDIVGNTTNTGYQLNSAGGTCSLAPFEDNLGTVTISGSFGAVPMGACACD